MSPVSRSKPKSAAKAAKEQSKVSSKASSTPNGKGVAASAYNPVSGTFHSLETVPPALVPNPQSNGRLITIDENEDNSVSSLGTTAEYDSLSNNGSCSGESEDHKEEPAPTLLPRAEPVPGAADTDKREKIRQKNEKKHQRQKERRAQEVHERCRNILMSRKLESLSQQLVAMGFPPEKATTALMLNEGRVEQSVAWLFDGSEEAKQAMPEPNGGNLKIDIADELARMADMELEFKLSKLGIERAVVASEGDLDKAAETLRVQKQEAAAAAAEKALEPTDEAVQTNGSSSRVTSPNQNPLVRTQVKVAIPATIQRQRRDERDFSYTKAIAAGVMQQEIANRNLQSLQALRKMPVKPDWSRPQATAVDKRWLNASSSPSVSYSLASPLHVTIPPLKPEARFSMAATEMKPGLQAGALREPVIVMQRPQSVNGKQNLPLTGIGINGSPPASTGWYPNDVRSMEMKAANGGLSHSFSKLSINGSSAQPYYPQSSMQAFVSNPMESGGAGQGGSSWSMMGSIPSSSLSSSSLAVPSSLGLFTGWRSSGSSGSSSPVDWTTGRSLSHVDYSSIDWSLDLTQLKAEMRSTSDGWSSSFSSMKASRPVMNGSGMSFVELQDGGSLLVDHPLPVVGSHEWTSPFAGSDLLRVPRQYVTSPSP